MSWKTALSLIFFVVAIALLGFYWIAPFNEIGLISRERNYNFSLNETIKDGMQFYQNMRFPTENISYRIENCPLAKSEEVKRAFDIISMETVLNFYGSKSNEEIFVTCDSKSKMEGELFVAGEGGPSNITKTPNFNVIKNGQILLLRESKCERPNVAIHELLHVLGFDHSSNPDNVMYNFSACNQEIGQDIIKTVNSLYSTPSLTDLSIENVSAAVHGRYLNTNISIMNIGLKDSENSAIKIYADEKLIEELDVEKLEVGYGRRIILGNILLLQTNFQNLKFILEYPDEELNKENNEMILKIK